MDFLNTRPTPRGVSLELIGDGASYVAWLQDAQLLQATAARTLRRRFGAAALDAAAAEARATGMGPHLDRALARGAGACVSAEPAV